MKITPNSLLARRYRVVSELPRTHSSSVIGWRSVDTGFGDAVVAYTWPGGSPGDGIASRSLGATFERVTAAGHPGLVSWHALDLGGSLAVREWLNGFTLLELLRRRRELRASEVIALLRSLPATLDWTTAHDLRRPESVLEHCWVVFQSSIQPLELLGEPVSSWPDHQLKLAVLRPRDLLQSDGSNTEQRTSISTGSSSAPRWLARLLRELLGGKPSVGRWTPLSALNETANRLVQNTLAGEGWRSAQEFWEAFASAVEEKTGRVGIRASSEPLDFSTVGARGPAPCRVAVLYPEDCAHLPIHLCSGDKFVLGRARSMVDFQSVILPETPENFERTGEISRQHAQLEVRDGALWLRDGNGESSSRNGTTWNQEPLSAATPPPLRTRGILTLGNRYDASILPIIGAFAPAAALAGKPVQSPGMPVRGAVVVSSVNPQHELRRVAWVLTSLGFGLHDSGEIVWHKGGSPGPSGIFLRAEQGFWFANLRFPPDSTHPEQPDLGQAVLLRDGQTLRIGRQSFSVSTRE